VGHVVTAITVLRPDTSAPPAATVSLAPRNELPERPVIGLVANGKPLAKELLTVLAQELGKRLGRDLELELHAKPSAAYPITDDEATMLAARSHLVITGLGD
jgi:hypothetical protein